MQTRYMERSNSMSGREKRALDSSSNVDEDGQPDRKRPALASVIVEALKVDSLQRLCSSLEPILRRVVSEEVERALAKLGPARLVGNGRSSPKRIEAPDGRNLQLHFRTKLSLPLFTGGKVEGEQGAAIHIVLIDANTGELVTTGPESSAKLDIVVLEGDFNDEDDANWTEEDFDSHVVKEREGKRPLLTGDVQVTLKEGVGTLGELTFTDNSSWIRSRQFRLGLKIAAGYCDNLRIREAKTEAFTVKDHRGELYKKHYPPALNDEVWRLEKIGKDGAFHKRLNKAGVVTVEHFLRFVIRDPQRLRNILGSGMSNKMWDALVEHAKTCVLGGKLYIYYPDGPQGVGVIFNSIYEFSGLIAGGQYYSTDSLSDTQKVYADTLIKKAYENWMHVVEYDGKSLLSLKQNRIEDSPRTESPVTQPNTNFYNHQVALPSLPVAPAVEQPSADPGLKMGGLHDALGTSYPVQSQTMNINGSSSHFSPVSVSPPNQFMGASGLNQPSRNSNGLNFGSTQPSLSGLQPVGTSDFADYRGSENTLSEEEIRMRSNQMLEHEDMQHLLRLFGMGGGHGQNPVGVPEDTYPYSAAYAPSPAINFNFEEDRTRSSGKAVVGWLKLKAALRWGIFIRKKAAERRAQIVELEET
ncbi:calmodulin-binding protein 60 C-like [Amaranthus tricolor]|uniref:calmodulin-binding protein 60 C-like n=1 Tax=Amaranthus tricolor TaxID=29722 RepID=UPI00258A2121|nr:calmodulin-binding protein 60 C-like [Amaranthus tricolor]